MPAEPVSAAVATTGSPPGPGAGRAWAALCGLTAAVHLGDLYFARELRAHLGAQLGLWLLAGLCWLLALGVLTRASPLVPRSGAERRALGLVWGLALLMRLPAVALPVGHSDDVYRYLWDGAVQHAGHSPYAGPPDAAEYAAVRAADPELHRRINHRELPTIYPPSAQLVFRAHAALFALYQTAARPRAGEESVAAVDDAALLSAVRLWKAMVVAADLLVLALLVALCRALRGDVRWATVWGLAPLPAVELAYNGHLESLGILPLMLALWLWQRSGWATAESGKEVPQPRWPRARPGDSREKSGEQEPASPRWSWVKLSGIGALLAAAVLVKPVAGAVLPALLRLPRRVLLGVVGGALLGALLLVVPYGRSGALPPSLGEYGRRWRSNDGAHAGLLAVTRVAVDRLYRPPYYEPWRWPRLARLVTGRDRDTVWPDELAGALTRGELLLALLALTGVGVRRRWSPWRLGLGLLLGYQLLTPVLHPWYELWPLALAALWPQLLWPVVVMAALAPLGHLALADYFAGHGFHEAVWPRLVQHGAGWATLLGVAVWRRWRVSPHQTERRD